VCRWTKLAMVPVRASYAATRAALVAATFGAFHRLPGTCGQLTPM
jgi:hypothetical protein